MRCLYWSKTQLKMFQFLKKKKSNFISCNFLVRMLQCFQKRFRIFLPLKTWKKQPWKLLIIFPDFFSALPIGPNPALISIPVTWKSPTAEILYNDFDYKFTLESTLSRKVQGFKGVDFWTKLFNFSNLFQPDVSLTKIFYIIDWSIWLKVWVAWIELSFCEFTQFCQKVTQK